MITSRVPQNWRELQEQTARILRECGFAVEVEKTLETVRGRVEIDVYAEETVDGRRYVILCECKLWRARVPQNVIHGFRTVVGDIGANLGLIVASEGFQPGAELAATFTNVRLVSWEQFQVEFEPTWLKRYLQETVTERCDPLLTFSEPFLPAWFNAMSEDNQDAYIALKQRHDEFGWMMMTFTRYHRMLNPTDFPALPLRPRIAVNLSAKSLIPDDVLDATAYREFLEAALAHSDSIIAQFRALRPATWQPDP